MNTSRKQSVYLMQFNKDWISSGEKGDAIGWVRSNTFSIPSSKTGKALELWFNVEDEAAACGVYFHFLKPPSWKKLKSHLTVALSSLLSCGEKAVLENANIRRDSSKTLTYSVDTLVVGFGEGFINLKFGALLFLFESRIIALLQIWCFEHAT